MRSRSKSFPLVCGGAAGLLLAFLLTGDASETDPSLQPTSLDFGYSALHADLEPSELAALLEDRQAVLFELQEALVAELEAAGRFHTFAVEGDRISTAPSEPLPFEVVGMRVKIVQEGAGPIGRTIPIPAGYDPVYDELSAECQWLSRRLELFETPAAESRGVGA